MKKPPAPMIEFAKGQGIRTENLKFVDAFATAKHFSIPAGKLHQSIFVDGFGFDDSTIRGWNSIEASDMLTIAGPERESFIFDNVQCDQKAEGTFCTARGEEAHAEHNPINLQFRMPSGSASIRRFSFCRVSSFFCREVRL